MGLSYEAHLQPPVINQIVRNGNETQGEVPPQGEEMGLEEHTPLPLGRGWSDLLSVVGCPESARARKDSDFKMLQSGLSLVVQQC